MTVATAVRDWVVECINDRRSPFTVRQSPSFFATSSFSSVTHDVIVAGTIFDTDDHAARLGLPLNSTLAHVVAEAVHQQGIGGIAHLVGRFALLIVERASGRLLGVRDHMGLFPLFYARIPGGLLFSTSTTALADQPEVTRAVNRVVLAEHLAHRWVDANETYFAAIRRVPPGHLLDVRDGGDTLRRYWNPSDAAPNTPLSDEEAVAQFNVALRRAVSRCLGQRRTAILLSGGFDSVSVAATASAISRETGRQTAHALSVVFPDPECNEEIIQRSVAQTLGMTHELLPMARALSGRGLLSAALEMGRSWPSPMLNLWSPAYFELASRGVRDGCDAILSGTGGDEWLNVTPCVSADLIRRGQLLQLARLTAVFQRSFRLSTFQILRNSLWTFGVRRLIGSAIARVAPQAWHADRHRREIARTPPWLAPDPALRREIDARAAAMIPPAHPGKGGYYERELQVSLTHPLVAIEYEEHFEFGQRVGAPLLSPYLDPDLVSVLYNTSPLTLTIGGRSKGLVRSAMHQAFPGLGLDRHKKVNASRFFRNVVQAEGPSEWARQGGAPELVRLGVLDGTRFEGEVTDLFAGRRPEHNYLIWDTLNVDGWIGAKRGHTSKEQGHA